MQIRLENLIRMPLFEELLTGCCNDILIYCLLASLNLLPNSNDAYIKLPTIFSPVIGQLSLELCSHWLQEKQLSGGFPC
jgi:hypothetical protein